MGDTSNAWENIKKPDLDCLSGAEVDNQFLWMNHGSQGHIPLDSSFLVSVNWESDEGQPHLMMK